MELPVLWFILIAVLWTGFLVLEGFDFGIGMLLRPFSRDDTERRVLINTIGPLWDGNEVWLIVAAGATFAAFPEWYATLFSGFYIPLLAILLALIVRGVAFEWRGKIHDDTWRNRWDWVITFGSWTPAVLFGVLLATFVRGVPLEDKQFVGTVADLFSPFALVGGAVTALVFLLHAAVFLALKTDGDIRVRVGALAARLAPAAAALATAWLVWLQLVYSGKTWTWVLVAVAVVALLAAVPATRARAEGAAFTFSAIAIVATVVLVFGSMYPNVLPSTLGADSALTVFNASSTEYTLGIMTWFAAVLTPAVLAYQGWTYWVFRRRLTTTSIPPHVGLPLREPREPGARR